MLSANGVAIADSGMRRIRRGNIDSLQDQRAGAHIPTRPTIWYKRSRAAKDGRPYRSISQARSEALCPQRASGERKPIRRLGDKPPHHQGVADLSLRGSALITEGCVPNLQKSRPEALDPSQILRSAIWNPQSALTLIELLAVIGILGVLAAISFGIARGVHERGAIGKARIEIAAIAQALEAYRVKYGDYPQTSSAATMLQCLIGRRGPTGAALTDKPLIEMARFSTVNDSDPFTAPTAVLMDSFGKSYNYAYKTSASWKNPSFVLYSTGPDGAVQGTLPADGFLSSAFESAFDATAGTGNPDNIYHGRN